MRPNTGPGRRAAQNDAQAVRETPAHADRRLDPGLTLGHINPARKSVRTPQLLNTASNSQGAIISQRSFQAGAWQPQHAGTSSLWLAPPEPFDGLLLRGRGRRWGRTLRDAAAKSFKPSYKVPHPLLLLLLPHYRRCWPPSRGAHPCR